MAESHSGVGIRRGAREFTMLVVGVLIALSADAWWQERQARSEIDLLLDALVTELEENRAELTSALQRRVRLVEQNRALVEVFNDGAPYPSVDSITPLVFSALGGRPPTLGFGAYDVLLARGSTEFVPADFLVRLTSHVGSARVGMRSDDHVREGVIEDITDAIARNGGFLTTTRQQFRRTRGLPSPANELDVAGLLGDPELQNAAAISVVLHYNWQGWLESRLRETEDLLADLQ